MISGALKRWWAFVVLFTLVVPPCALSQDAPTVEKIELDGLVRIPDSTVRSKLRTRVGSKRDPGVVSEDIKRLFGMRVFQDVRVAVKPTKKGIIVRYLFAERPTLATVKFEGNDELDEEDLGKVNSLRRFEIVKNFPRA